MCQQQVLRLHAEPSLLQSQSCLVRGQAPKQNARPHHSIQTATLYLHAQQIIEPRWTAEQLASLPATACISGRPPIAHQEPRPQLASGNPPPPSPPRPPPHPHSWNLCGLTTSHNREFLIHWVHGEGRLITCEQVVILFRHQLHADAARTIRLDSGELLRAAFMLLSPCAVLAGVAQVPVRWP